VAAGKVTRREWAIAAALCLLTFIIYWLSLAPTITWQHDGADSGDLATAVALGGVPHPSGYPTYLLLADLFNMLPLGGDVAYRLNVMSAICAAVAVGLLSLAAIQASMGLFREDDPQAANLADKRRSVPFGFVEVSTATAVLTFAFSPPFWSQAVIAEVYTLNALFVALLLWLASRVRAGSKGHLKWLCLTAGLALGNHLSVMFLLPLIGALVWPTWGRQSLGLRAGLPLLVLAGLSLYGLLPWRAAAQPPVNWGGADRWTGFRWLVTGEAYREYALGLPWAYVGSRALALVRIIVRALAWWGLPVALWGWRLMVRHDRSLAVGSLLTVGLIAIYAVGYNTVDSYLYLLPALMLMSLWLAWGLLDLLCQARPYLLRPWTVWALLLLPIFSIVLNFSAMSLRRDWTALDFAEDTLGQAASGALILVDDDRHTFALWYARYALGQRPDVAIVNANLLGYDWYQASLSKAHPDLALAQEAESLVRQNMDQHPVYAIGDTLTLSNQFVIEAAGDIHQLRKVSEATEEPP
jgi:hypothetical protein